MATIQKIEAAQHLVGEFGVILGRLRIAVDDNVQGGVHVHVQVKVNAI